MANGVRIRLIEVAGWQRRTKVTWRHPTGCIIEGAWCESDTRTLHVGDGEIPADSKDVERYYRDQPILWTPERCTRCGKSFVDVPLTDAAAEEWSPHMLTWTLERMSTSSGEPEVGDVWYASDAASQGRSWGHFISHVPHDSTDCGIDGCTATGPLRCTDTKYSDGRIHTRGWHNCDGRHLLCKCPGGAVWDIDGRGGNCTKPDDVTHRCWVRTGSPVDGTMTVGKGGVTCDAGAGSIRTHNWHGFLRRGRLVVA